MSYKGVIERAAIIAKLKTINDGRVDDLGDDADSHPRYDDESVKPYSQIIFGVPRPTIGNRTLADGQKDIPHIMSFTITAIANTRTAAGELAGAIRELLVDWSPTSTCNPVECIGGFTDPISSRGNQNRPSRYSESSSFTVVINMGADA